MTVDQLYPYFLAHPQICTDTRKITEDCIFFALKGENFNGNEYASEALEKGAAYAIVDEQEYASSNRHFLVKNVLKCLQDLATFHRNNSKAKVIALTGSNGKTTTKELIYAVLSKKYNTTATAGNLNNHIGVPLTLLSIKENDEMAIIEMGANHKKEIEFLSALARPDFGYITNFGKAHLEGFGGVQGVIKGKSELYDYLMANDKVIFMNADDEIQQMKLGLYVKKFGFSVKKDQYYKINLLDADPFVKIEVENQTIQTKLIGRYNFTNCAAAILIGKYFNVSADAIKDAIEAYTPANNRSQILSKNGHHIILDAYNANPTSMKAALENFQQLKAHQKIVFLGDMFELGETAAEEHQQIADMVTKMELDKAFLIGNNFNRTSTKTASFDSFERMKDYLSQNPIAKKATILIKGSRGMAMERLIDLL
ncbi:UDP-N-acetylmuramoyl-tripeptide--D-alanyl-D-alanine ligase [Pareuzebyella sediminis]|uniref:UDP-N-acetylmuramoyl-tripeptide--D-alanyl-D- alanine ligase n=1 Tax=Pareuzebyella sediminis TaxID=2607998 RepID=UPI0011ED07A6|nr:UDP-N-acetylmuramoyl-tripeptide--D-alanyl-D-alanine ligase [Pareuzebyella sediminis]